MHQHYEWSADCGPDDLSDVSPLDGGVPTDCPPNASRLADLIGEPGGFELWALETLGEFEAIQGYDLALLEDLRQLYMTGEWEERTRAARETNRLLGSLDATAAYLGDTPLNTLRTIRRTSVDAPVRAGEAVVTPETVREIEQMRARGESLTTIGAHCGVDRTTVQRVVVSLSIAKGDPVAA